MPARQAVYQQYGALLGCDIRKPRRHFIHSFSFTDHVSNADDHNRDTTNGKQTAVGGPMQEEWRKIF